MLPRFFAPRRPAPSWGPLAHEPRARAPGPTPTSPGPSAPQDGRNSIATTTSLAYFPKKTQTQNLLHELPKPQRQVAIAVYGFTDQTGQFKPSDVGQTLSRAAASCQSSTR
jgi:hypothetical protein